MSDNRITCVTGAKSYGHDGHIITIGNATRKWTVTEARQAIDRGDIFHTISPSTDKRAEVRKWTCTAPGCSYRTLKSSPDAVTDNDLDNVPPCGY